MNKLHQLAIELKYEGKTYEEISEALNNELTAGTIKKYFAHGGMLEFYYAEYEAEQLKLRDSEARTIFRKEVSRASKIIIESLDRAVSKGDDRLALEAAGAVLDRAGLTVKQAQIDAERRKHQEEQKPKHESLDDLYKDLVKRGIDPLTCRSIGTDKFLTEEERIEKLVKEAKEMWSKYNVYGDSGKVKSVD